jgi:F0F1-type ATP synthase membrane subunit b/b'
MRNPNQAGLDNGFWPTLGTFLQEHGLLGLVLVFLLFFFWKMIWKVWSAAMESKDREIERLVEEKRWLQKQLMRRTRLSAKPEELESE